MTKNNKLNNTREVTFSEDYNPNKINVIYAKGTVHYIHKDNLDTLKKGGAKFTSKELDKEKMMAEAVKEFEASQKTK